MLLIETAIEYCRRKQIARVPVCSAKRFAQVIGNIKAIGINQRHIEDFVASARSAGMPEWTIKGTIKDVRTLVINAGGPVLRNPVRKPPSDPQPCEISDIDAFWPWLAPWSEQLTVLLYWTGARLDDAIRIQLDLVPGPRALQWGASKTGRKHRVPAPEWLFRWLEPVQLPYCRANDHAQTIVRGELDRVCKIAGVPRILPSQIRDRGITEWSKASSDAGAILHGHGLGTRDHYVPALEVLTAAMDRVRVPASFGAAQSTESSLLSAFRRLDPAAQLLISGTAERLAAG